MAEAKTFKIKVRLYASGEQYALTESDVDNGNDMDDVSSGEGPYREFYIEVTAELPPVQTVAITVPAEPAPLTEPAVAATAA